MQQPGALVLVVEDDPLTCRLVEFLLASQGYGVVLANHPRAALASLQQQPDLVLLDVQLPEMDGLQLLSLIKVQQRNTPVIMLTARTEMPDKLEGLEAGADDYITKPFEPEELLVRVKANLRRSRRTADDPSPPLSSSEG